MLYFLGQAVSLTDARERFRFGIPSRPKDSVSDILLRSYRQSGKQLSVRLGWCVTERTYVGCTQYVGVHGVHGVYLTGDSSRAIYTKNGRTVILGFAVAIIRRIYNAYNIRRIYNCTLSGHPYITLHHITSHHITLHAWPRGRRRRACRTVQARTIWSQRGGAYLGERARELRMVLRPGGSGLGARLLRRCRCCRTLWPHPTVLPGTWSDVFGALAMLDVATGSASSGSGVAA